jgi:diguanylate cyclase (GGDEF)-like protein/PAS domain S-box-containing protein
MTASTHTLDSPVARPLIALRPKGVERRSREARRVEAETLAHLLVAGAPAGSVMQDKNLRILSINPAAERLLGVTAKEALGQPMDILANCTDEAGAPVMGNRSPVSLALITGQPVLGNAVYFDGRSGSRWLWISAKPLFREGEAAPYAVLSSLEDITALREAQSALERTAYYDVLTGLPNRQSLLRHLGPALAAAENASQSLAILHVNLDRFKNINDSYGHLVGDKILRAVAARLTRAVRDVDGLFRVGGDDFVVALANTDRAQANIVADRLMAALAVPFPLDAAQFYTSACVGGAIYVPGSVPSADDLLKGAGSAMSHAKVTGQGHCRFFEPKMLVQAQERVWLDNNLRRGIEEGQFELYYQPKADARTGRLAGVEALVRWNHPDAGVVSPLRFIPFAEESGLVVPLGSFVLQEASRQALVWHARGLSIPIAVNVAAAQLQGTRLLTEVRTFLETSGLPPHLLELELTESALVSDEAHAATTLDALRALGIKLYIDDFGAGYSSLAQLANFSFDALKIDLAFIAKITTDPKAHALVRTIVLLGKALNLKVVAEGVESPAQLQCLQTLGCDEIQGYLASQPLTITALEATFALGTVGGALLLDFPAAT